MRRSWRIGSVAFACLWIFGVTGVAAPTNDPAVARQRHECIASQLDAGGDLLVVANVEGYIERTVSAMAQAVLHLTNVNAKSRDVAVSLGKVPGFLNRAGFYALQGFGLSVVPRGDGLNTIKGFVARDPEAASLPLWRGLVGGEPRRLSCADFLPADTVLARTGGGEPGQFWQIVRSAVAEIGSPAAARRFEQRLSDLAATNGVPLDRIFASLGDEGAISLQLSETATVTLPGARQTLPVKFPRPSLLLVLAVKDGSLAAAIEASLARAKAPVTVTDGETAIQSFPLPVPLPFPVLPAYATHSGFFLFGTTPEVVAAALKAYRNKTGLTATPAYRAAFQGLPEVNNGMFYLNPRLTAAYLDLQTALASQQSAAEAGAGIRAFIRDMTMGQERSQSAFVYQNLRTGILESGHSTAGSREIVGSAMVAPVGLLAAVAIPSFVKARTTSQQNACINNLRQIDAAKEQWAMENNKTEGAPVVVSEMVRYLKGGKVPVCPREGRYQINPVGKDPRCSIPEHRL